MSSWISALTARCVAGSRVYRTMSWAARSGSLAMRLAARVGASPRATALMNAVCSRVSWVGVLGGLVEGVCFGVFM